MLNRATVQFAAGGAPIVIGRPIFGYRTMIDLPFSIQEISRGQYKIFDPLSSYDVRSCRCTFVLNETDQSALITFLKGDARCNDVTMTLSTNSGFFPFGPDKKDGSAFTVSLSNFSFNGIGEEPWKYFKTEITITNIGAYPAYSPVLGATEGNLQIGNVTGLRFPPQWFRPSQRHAVDTQITRGSNSFYVDRTNSADAYNTSFNFSANEGNMGKVLEYLTGTARAQLFSLVSAGDYYPFGYERGNGTHTVRLVQKSIEVLHSRYDRFSTTFKLSAEI